jgi:hypothetical protein
MTQARLRKAKRLLEVQREMQRLEEGRVAALRARQGEIATEQEEIVAALNADEALQGLFVAATARRLKRLSEEETRVTQDVEQRTAALRTQAGRTRYAEKQAEACERELEAAAAKNDLLEIIERSVRAKDASLP